MEGRRSGFLREKLDLYAKPPEWKEWKDSAAQRANATGRATPGGRLAGRRCGQVLSRGGLGGVKDALGFKLGRDRDQARGVETAALACPEAYLSLPRKLTALASSPARSSLDGLQGNDIALVFRSVRGSLRAEEIS